MNRQSIRVVVILAIISILGIILTQLFWIGRAFDLKEREFNDRVNITLRAVAKQIQTVHKDSSDLPPVKQLTSNYFVVSMNDTLHPYLLESLLKSEFEKRNLLINFEYGIYDCYNDSIVYGNYVYMNTNDSLKQSASDKDAIHDQEIKPPAWDDDGHYFGVYFPEKRAYIASNMEIWVFSSVILLFVIVFFGYTMSIILKQRKLSEIKNDFINNMTHEFRTPISTISVSSEMLLRDDIGAEPDRRKMYSKMIYDESLRLKTLVEKVLQMADINSADLKLNKEEIDLHEVIKRAVENMRVVIEEKKGKVVTNLNAENNRVFADRVHLTNIIYNLLDNATKYCERDPEVVISTQNDGKGIMLSIQDNGIGMSKEAQKHVFSKFYRVPTGDVHNIKGFGLGLFYVKTVIEAHKGKITLESEPDKGSRFNIYLPLK